MISDMLALNTPTYMRLRDQIRADIVAGVWPLGGHITLAQLSDRYQVSTNPIREALLQLQGEGVVDMRMNKGAIVPMLDEKYIDDLYRLRGAIQFMMTRDAARNATPAQVTQMLAYCDEFEKAAALDDAPACLETNRQLHRCIDQAADNSIAAEILEGRSSLVDAFRRQIGYGEGRLSTVVVQHRELVQAISAGDELRAANVSLEHTESARVDLIRAFNQVNP